MNERATFGLAKQMGYFSQMIPEFEMRSIPTLLDNPPVWKSLLATEDSEEFSRFKFRIESVTNNWHVRSESEKKQIREKRAQTRAALARNRYFESERKKREKIEAFQKAQWLANKEIRDLPKTLLKVESDIAEIQSILLSKNLGYNSRLLMQSALSGLLIQAERTRLRIRLNEAS